jgi:hypothetical protein
MSSGHDSERPRGKARPARAGGTRQHEVTMVRRARRARAGGAGSVRLNRTAREAERRRWAQSGGTILTSAGRAVGVSAAAGVVVDAERGGAGRLARRVPEL